MIKHKELSEHDLNKEFFKLFVKAQGKYPANSIKEAAYITILCRKNFGYVPDFKSASNTILASNESIKEIARIAENAHEDNTLAAAVEIDRDSLALVFNALHAALKLTNDLNTEILQSVLDDDFSFLQDYKIDTFVLKGAKSHVLEIALRAYLAN